MNRPGPLNRSLSWESGAKDARTPNADASSADSVASAKRLECVRFIGAFRHAGRPMVHGSNARFLHEPTPRPLPCKTHSRDNEVHSSP